MEQNLTRIFTLFGGLALFLYGMDALSHSLETAAGSRLKSLLAAVTGSPVRGVLAGAAVTAVLQSSSAVTVMVLGFVSAGLLTLRQAVPVIFGCNIGTTITAQLLAFRLEDMRGLVLLAGLLLCFACAGRKARAIGRAVFAFGLLFEGIADMGTAMEPLAQSPVFVHWLGRVRQHPWLGLLAGLHLCFAFPFVHKLLMLFNLNNVKLLIGTTALSYVVFALLYTLAYRLTSNAYYQIVSGARED